MRGRKAAFLAAVLAVSAMTFAAPSTQPAQTPNQLKAMGDAYRKLKTLSLAGTIDLTADIGGQKESHHAEFTAAFGAPMKFRHEIKGDAVAAGVEGEKGAADDGKVYVFVPADNVYSIDPLPAERGSFDDLSDDARSLLRSQDPSLVFALTQDPALDLVLGSQSVAAAANVVIDGKSCPALTVTWTDKEWTLILDPATHLVRRVIVNLAPGLKARGADVRTALVTIDYTTSQSDTDLKPAELAFAPPPTAQQIESPAAGALALVGKPAPRFRLKDAGGVEVADAGAKGSVSVLVFWSTSSLPSADALSAAQDLYQAHNADGLKIITINQQEAAAAIEPFITQLHLTLPVLLDPDGKVNEAYGAELLPETVVVGRDGIVKKVFIGPGNEGDIAVAVAAALRAH